jgi:hypothetical protein
MYKHGASFKYQMALFELIPRIWRHIGADHNDCAHFVQIAKIYCNDEKQPIELRKAAINAIQLIDEYISSLENNAKSN